MDQPERILYVMPSPLMRAGTESYVMNYYRHLDRDQLQIDFLVHGNWKGDYDDEVVSLGGRIFSVPRRGLRPDKNVKAVRDFLSHHHYRLVHAHMDAGNYIPLKLAREAGIPIRISHSHNTSFPENNPIRLIWDLYQRNRIPGQATQLFACSKAAASWLYGDENLDKTLVVNNAIDQDRFAFDPAARERIRTGLDLAPTDIVLGHIGRFVYQKNHEFLVQMFARLAQTDPRYRLVMIGEGEELEPTRQAVDSLGIADAVRFVETTPDIHEYYSAFDLFVLPSRFEGLPVVGVEAQANGLTCIFSDKVTEETDVLHANSFLPVEGEGAIDAWVELIRALGDPVRRPDAADALVAAGYGVEQQTQFLQDTYLRLLAEAQG